MNPPPPEASLVVGVPLGFPRCAQCAYLRHGSPATCLSCVTQSDNEVMADEPTAEDGRGASDAPTRGAGRWYRSATTTIRVIAQESSAMRATVFRYKFDQRMDWSLIFGRLLVAWLDRHARVNTPDLILANPTFVGDQTTFAYAERVLDAAANEDALGEWPFDTARPRLLIKVAKTKGSASAGVHARRVAGAELFHALAITDRTQIEGRHVLLYDNEASSGTTLGIVAEFLRTEGGARHVESVVLTRSARGPGRRTRTP